MKVLFVEYPKCSTCKKAGKWLQEHGVGYDDRHIVEQNPTAEELKEWHEKSGLPLKRFFNTSGQVYRNNGIKDKLPGMSEKEQYALLATDVNNIMLYLWSDSLLQFQCFFDRRDDSTPNKFTQLTVLSSVSKVGL